MAKTGLICEGGGMKCAYGAGVLDAFLDDGITFDYCIGVSAGTANLASYLGGQRGRNLRFYTTHIKEPGYFGFKSFVRTGDLFGLDYIYGTLSNSDGADAIDFQAICRNPTEYKITATNANTGLPVYFDKTDISQDDYRCIMASCAIPAACRPVEIGGEYYYDGGISDSIPVQKALDDGCDKIVAILSKPHDFVKEPEGHRFLYRHMCRKYPLAVRDMDRRHIMYKKCQDTLFALEDEGKAFVFAPKDPPKVGTYTMDPEVNRKLYDMGMEDYQNYRESFAAFMSAD